MFSRNVIDFCRKWGFDGIVQCEIYRCHCYDFSATTKDLFFNIKIICLIIKNNPIQLSPVVRLEQTLSIESHCMTKWHPMRLVSIVVNFDIKNFMKLIKIIVSRNWRPKAAVLKFWTV